MIKENIFYHRAYRKEEFSKKKFFMESTVLLSPILLILFLYPIITLQICKFSAFILQKYFSVGKIKVLGSQYVFSPLYIISMKAFFHSPMFYLLFFLFSIFTLIVMLFFSKLYIFKPVFLYLMYIAIINVISSAFFVLAPIRFPYNIKIFSALYMKTEVSIWFFIPVIFTLTLALLPSSLISKLLVSFSVLIYSIIFGTVRYVLFLYVLRKFSFVLMAPFFFVFGPLVDFIYIVGIYSYYLSFVSEKNRNTASRGWKWLY